MLQKKVNRYNMSSFLLAFDDVLSESSINKYSVKNGLFHNLKLILNLHIG